MIYWELFHHFTMLPHRNIFTTSVEYFYINCTFNLKRSVLPNDAAASNQLIVQHTTVQSFIRLRSSWCWKRTLRLLSNGFNMGINIRSTNLSNQMLRACWGKFLTKFCFNIAFKLKRCFQQPERSLQTGSPQSLQQIQNVHEINTETLLSNSKLIVTENSFLLRQEVWSFKTTVFWYYLLSLINVTSLVNVKEIMISTLKWNCITSGKTQNSKQKINRNL